MSLVCHRCNSQYDDFKDHISVCPAFASPTQQSTDFSNRTESHIPMECFESHIVSAADVVAGVARTVGNLLGNTRQLNVVRELQIAVAKTSRLKVELDSYQSGSAQHASIASDLEKWIAECSRLQAEVGRSSKAKIKEARYVGALANSRKDLQTRMAEELETLKKQYDSLLGQHSDLEKKLAEVERKWMEADSQLHKERREKSELVAALEAKRSETVMESRERDEVHAALEAKCAEAERRWMATTTSLQAERDDKRAFKEGSDLCGQLEIASYGLSVLRAVAEITKLPSHLMGGLQIAYSGISEVKKQFEIAEKAFAPSALSLLRMEVEKWAGEYLRLHDEVLSSVRHVFEETNKKEKFVVEQDIPKLMEERTREVIHVVEQDVPKLAEELVPTVQIGTCKVALTAENGISLAKVLEAKPFKEWIDRIAQERRIEVSRIHVQSLDMFGARVGSIKFRADSSVNGTQVPGIVFMRGGAVAVLVILHHADRRYALVVRQPRVPICLGAVAEIAVGMLDGDGNFAGEVAKEMKEAAGIHIRDGDLLDMTTLYYEQRYPGVLSSCGGSDESHRIFLYQKTVSSEELASLRGKLTGVPEEGEVMKLQIVPLESLWRISPDAKSLAAISLYEKLKSDGRIPPWHDPEDSFHDAID